VALAGAGCATRQDKLREILRAREQRMQEQAEQQQPAVFFRGDIRNPRVPWKEGLTLAEAIAVAQYTWSWDPRQITVARHGEMFAVNPKRLLRGQENPLLEPGDVIEVRH
jgi:hypothetical protein